MRGSSSCAPVPCCAAERPVNLASPAPDPFAPVCRPLPVGSQARRAPATAAGAAVAAGTKCACVLLATRCGLKAASRCAWPSCGGRVVSAVAYRRCGSSFFFVGEARWPLALPPVLSQVQRAAPSSPDRACAIRVHFCRSCCWILNPADRRALRPIINGATWPGVKSIVIVISSFRLLLRPQRSVWPVPSDALLSWRQVCAKTIGERPKSRVRVSVQR